MLISLESNEQIPQRLLAPGDAVSEQRHADRESDEDAEAQTDEETEDSRDDD